MTGYKDPPPGFKKGDPRINRKGRPKSFDALRALAKMIANEPIPGKSLEGEPILMSRVELILRSWAASRGNWQLQRQFMEIAYGKVKDEVELTGKDGKPIEFTDLSDREAVIRILAVYGLHLPPEIK
jgi:hypothetical protein